MRVKSLRIVFLIISFLLSILFLSINSKNSYAACVCTDTCSQYWPFSFPSSCNNDAYMGCQYWYSGAGPFNGCCLFSCSSTWTVTFSGNGGSCSPTSRSPIEDGASSLGSTCTRTGYVFNNFTINPSSGACTSFNTSTGACSAVNANFTATAQWTLANSDPTAPTNLLTEGATNPTCVIDTTPEFSAIYNDPNVGDIANNYEIEVNTNSAFTGTVMWDTGKTAMANLIAGSRIPDKSYAGTALSLSGTTYYWRIRFWDDSDAVSGWSAVANFTIGCNVGCGSCTAGTYSATQPDNTYYSGTCTYTNSCCATSTSNCWSACGCTPLGAPVCPSGTSETASAPIPPLYSIPANQTDYHSTTSTCCNRNNGNTPSNCSPSQTCNTRTCNCEICTISVCGPTYSDADLTYGNLTRSCRNGLSSTPDQLTLCSLTYKDCYCREFKTCPAPLQDHNLTNPNLILEGFRENTNACGVSPIESEDDCYEVFSAQPTETFSIDSAQAVENDFGFSSTTQTGDYGGYGTPDTTIGKQGRLNDPLSPIKMVAKYRDTTASDIEGMFVWFQKDTYTLPPETPILISDSIAPKTSNTDSWGFMLRRVGEEWIPYVPSYGTSYYWTKAPNIPPSPFDYPLIFYIYGPSGESMVEVTILEEPSESLLLQEITMKYSLKFSDEDGDLFGNVNEGNYKIWLMGLDKFSFTPYDNYTIDYRTYWTSNYTRNPDRNLSHYWIDGQLRYKDGIQNYARAWTNSGSTWILDFTDPEVNFSKTIDENIIRISWNVSDDRNLYAIVGNIYTDAGSDARQIDLDVNGTPSHPIVLNPSNGVFIPGAVGGNIVGNLDSGWSFKVEPNLNSLTNSGSIDIKVGNNTSGSLTIYLHVFDDAGNVTDETLTENLADRLLTGGGLAYSYGGTTFAQLTPADGTDTLWLNTLPPYLSTSEGLLRMNAGLTSEMLARSSLPTLANDSRGSYTVENYSNNSISNTISFYDSLLETYDLHKKEIENLYEQPVVHLDSIIASNDLSNFCGTSEYCRLIYEANLTISSGFICNERALIFVQGNLIINPPLFNTSSSNDSLSNTNGCIFVVGGDVIIAAGSRVSDATTFRYDKINAFIVSEGKITVRADTFLPPNIVDGVYINGGLISKGGTRSIVIERYLRLQERLLYPVLAIDLHPKYGILAEQFFGNSYVIQSTEVGLKPY